MSGQPVTDIPLPDFEIGREDLNRTLIFRKVTTSVNRDDGSLLFQAAKVVPFEAVVENNGEGKGKRLTSFN